MNKVLNVTGMGCSGCVNSVENALKELEGVTAAEVKLDAAIAEVSYDENKVTLQDFEKAIEDAGYEMTGVKA